MPGWTQLICLFQAEEPQPSDSSSSFEDIQISSWQISSFLAVTNSSMEGDENLITVLFQEMTDFKVRRTQSEHQSLSVPHWEVLADQKWPTASWMQKGDSKHLSTGVLGRSCIPWFFSSSAFEPNVISAFTSYLWWWHSHLGSAHSEPVTSTAWPVLSGNAYRLPSCRDEEHQGEIAPWPRLCCQKLAPTITWLTPLLPAHGGSWTRQQRSFIQPARRKQVW